MSENRVFIVKNSSLGTSAHPYVVPSGNGRYATIYRSRIVDVASFPSQVSLAHNNVVQSGTWTANNMNFYFVSSTTIGGASTYISFSVAIPSGSPSNTNVNLNATYGPSNLNLPIRNTLEGDGLSSGNYYAQPITSWSDLATDTKTVTGIGISHIIYGGTPVSVYYDGTFTANLYRRISVTKGDMFWGSNLPILPEILGRWFFEIKLEYKIVCTGHLTRTSGSVPAWVVDPSDVESTPQTWTFDYTMRKSVGFYSWTPAGNYVFHTGSTGNSYVTTNTGNLVVS